MEHSGMGGDKKLTEEERKMITQLWENEQVAKGDLVDITLRYHEQINAVKNAVKLRDDYGTSLEKKYGIQGERWTIDEKGYIQTHKD